MHDILHNLLTLPMAQKYVENKSMLQYSKAKFTTLFRNTWARVIALQEMCNKYYLTNKQYLSSSYSQYPWRNPCYISIEWRIPVIINVVVFVSHQLFVIISILHSVCSLDKWKRVQCFIVKWFKSPPEGNKTKSYEDEKHDKSIDLSINRTENWELNSVMPDPA